MMTELWWKVFQASIVSAAAVKFLGCRWNIFSVFAAAFAVWALILFLIINISDFLRERRKKNKEGEGYVPRIALVGGGRYDGLVKLLGGEPTRAVGGSMGIERVISILKQKDGKFPKSTGPVVFLAQLGSAAKRKSLKLFEEFRREKIRVGETLGRDSLKAQLRMADKLGVRYTLLLGQKEVLEGTIIVRDMKTGRQDTVKLERAVREIKKRVKK